MANRQASPREMIEALADALGREPYTAFTKLAVDLQPSGTVTQEQAVRIAKISRNLGVMESNGLVSVSVSRDGSISGWRLTEKGEERSRQLEGSR